MQYYLNDTTGIKIDSAIIFLASQTDLYSKKQLVQAYLINENCLLAQNVLDSLPQLTEEDIVFKNYYNIMLELCTQGKTVYDLTPAQKQTMYSIVTTNTTTATAAKNVLTLVYGEYYPEIIEQLYEPSIAGIKGNLYESFDCGGSPVADAKIYLFDENNELVTSVSPAITDSSGFFWFNNYYLSLLDTTALYSINTVGGFKIENPEFKTIPEWFNSSPLTLNLSKANREWYDFYSSVDSLYNGGNAIDLDGNIYVAGFTSIANNTDFLTIKYSPIGQRLWVKTYNGTGNADDMTIDIEVDKDNNCYVLGNSEGNGTGQDIVLIKYAPDGNQLWVNRYNGTPYNVDVPKALAVDLSGNIYVTGYTKPNLTSSNIITIKYSKTGTVTWVKTYNINPVNIASDIKVDFSGNVIVAGSTGTSTNMNFITIKYNKNGSVLWTKLYDSGVNDNIKALSVDNNNNIIITGNGTNVITIKYNSSGVQQWLVNNGGTVYDIVTDIAGNAYITGLFNTNGFTIKYNSVGTIIWNQTYSSIYTNGVDIMQAVTLDKNNDVYVTGWSASAPYYTKSFEMVAIKYNTDGNEMWVEKLNGNSPLQAAGNDIVISDNLNVYVTGRVYDDNIFKMATVKYSQCPATAMLKSAEASEIIENETENQKPETENQPWLYAKPNPINQSSVLAVNTASENECVIEITDIFGRLVKTLKVQGGYSEVQIPRSELSKGIYNISLMQNGKKVAVSGMTVIE
ncbi:MAG: hypothetical protein COS14_01880 [Bacteroidetes bacterium CG02_land_8_20_14_3_00_31_25]|nr:MAG: hypothetical protein COS14_01880 [Bacteroidetes bacterium CG02_land_8_20_14_3_00_31_25]